MKKAMSFLLAVLLLCGGLAVGAGAALSEEDEDAIYCILYGAYLKHLYAAESSERPLATIIFLGSSALIFFETLYLDGSPGLDAFFNEVENLGIPSLDDALQQVIDNLEAQNEALYTAGTLKQTVDTLMAEAVEAWFASVPEEEAAALLAAYVKPEALVFTKAFAGLWEYLFWADAAPYLLTDEEFAAFAAVPAPDVSTFYFEILRNLLGEGKLAEATAATEEFADRCKQWLIDAGILEPDPGPGPGPGPNPNPDPDPDPDPIFDFFASFLPEGVANVLTFIVKYIFFGWLWGRWL